MIGSQSPARQAGRVWSVIGIISGTIAFLFFPILFGPLGIVLGFVGRRKGDETIGLVAIIISIIGLVVGIIFGAVIGAMSAIQQM